MNKIARISWLGGKIAFPFILLLLLYPISSVSSQTEPSFRLKIGVKMPQPRGVPVLTRTGECVAWQKDAGISLLDRQGKQLTDIPGKLLKYAASPEGGTVAVLEKIAKAGAKKGEVALILRWYDREGKSRGNYQFSQDSDDPLPQLQFSTEGSHLVLAPPATARLIFLQRDGQMLREQVLFAEAPYTNERPLFLAAGNDAFFVLSQAMPSTTNKAVAPVFIRFSLTGEEQWRRELSTGTAGGLAVSEDGHWIVANRYAASGSRVESTISLFDGDGKLHITIDGLFRQALFSKNGDRLLLMDRRQLRMINVPDGEQQWQVNLARRSDMFAGIAATADAEKVIALVAESAFKRNRFAFDNARLVGYDAGGRQQFEEAVQAELVSPTLAISEDGQRLTLAAENLVQNFTIVDSTK